MMEQADKISFIRIYLSQRDIFRGSVWFMSLNRFSINHYMNNYDIEMHALHS